MKIQQEINFNDPVEVTRIFRMDITEKRKSEEDEDDKPKKIIKREHAGKVCFGWEDVTFIEEFAYQDDWNTYKGPKYLLKLACQQDSIVVLGDYNSMYIHWRMFRNANPIFGWQDDLNSNG